MKDLISYSDFAKIEIRLGTIISAELNNKLRKPSYVLKIDFGDEMADVLFVLMGLANQCGVNLEQSLTKNLAKKTKRDQDRHRNNPKLS